MNKYINGLKTKLTEEKVLKSLSNLDNMLQTTQTTAQHCKEFNTICDTITSAQLEAELECQKSFGIYPWSPKLKATGEQVRFWTAIHRIYWNGLKFPKFLSEQIKAWKIPTIMITMKMARHMSLILRRQLKEIQKTQSISVPSI